MTAVEGAEEDPSKAHGAVNKAEEESLSLDCFTCFFLGPSRAMP